MTKQITPTQAAYAAGVFDGEGSVWVDTYTPNLSINVQVVMTKPEVIDWFLSVYGGRHMVRKDKYGPVYSWSLSGAKILTFVDSIMPYVVLKGTQLNLAAGFARTMDRHRCTRLGIEPAVLLLRHKIAEAIGELNKRRRAPAALDVVSPQTEDLSSESCRKEDVQ